MKGIDCQFWKGVLAWFGCLRARNSEPDW